MAEPDAIVIGSGPNGLTAAATIARAGHSVAVVEAAPTPGGGARTAELTEPGFHHDVCSAIHPFGIASPAFTALDLVSRGLHWVHPDAPLAHPLDTHTVLLERSVDATAAGLGADGGAWRRLFGPVAAQADGLLNDVTSGLRVPRHPIGAARFARSGLRPATALAAGTFATEAARALFAGLAAHSVLPLDRPLTAGVGLLLGALGHATGWPLAAGGSQAIIDALLTELASLGGTIECDRTISSLSALPSARVVLADVGPRGLDGLAGDRLPRPLPGAAACVPLWTGGVQARLRAVGAGAVARPGHRPRPRRSTSAAPSTRSPPPKPLRGTGVTPRHRSCSSPSRACSTRPAPPPAGTRCGPTATSRTDRTWT